MTTFPSDSVHFLALALVVLTLCLAAIDVAVCEMQVLPSALLLPSFLRSDVAHPRTSIAAGDQRAL